MQIAVNVINQIPNLIGQQQQKILPFDPSLISSQPQQSQQLQQQQSGLSSHYSSSVLLSGFLLLLDLADARLLLSINGY